MPAKELTNAEVEARYGNPAKREFLESLKGLPADEVERRYVENATGAKKFVPMDQRLKRIADAFGYESIEQLEADAGLDDTTTNTEYPDNE